MSEKGDAIMEKGCINTDKEIWRKVKDDFYSPSISVTKQNGISINVGGFVIVKPIEKWFELAREEIKTIKKKFNG